MSMTPKTDNMDEEKSFEVIQEGVQKDFENQPHLVRRGLTEISAMFDRNGKGYLDDTERALRRMDSQNQGYLGIDKVCIIFESLQAEQERSSQLLEALRTESKKALNLKKGVIALTIFSILLALANVGTSFAVAQLVQDTSVSDGDLQVKGTGVRVGTTDKLMVFEVSALDEGRRRRLLASAGLVCDQMVGTVQEADENGVIQNQTSKECALQGTIKFDIAEDLHDKLEVVERVLLDCNHKKSSIKGTIDLPATDPGIIVGLGMQGFPSSNANEKYEATQKVFVPAVPAIPGQSSAVPAYNCHAEFQLAMFCPTELIDGKYQECLVMTAFDPTQTIPGTNNKKCSTSPIICGPAPVEPSLIN